MRCGVTRGKSEGDVRGVVVVVRENVDRHVKAIVKAKVKTIAVMMKVV